MAAIVLLQKAIEDKQQDLIEKNEKFLLEKKQKQEKALKDQTV